MTSTSHLGLPLLTANQANASLTLNQALSDLDALVQCAVVSRTVTSPPASPSNGTTYIVPAGATGAWTGQTNAIAVYLSGAWTFFTPSTGWQAYSLADSAFYYFTASSGWQTLPYGTGSGNVSTAGGPSQYQLAAFATGTTIDGIPTGSTSSVLVGGGASANPAFGDVPNGALVPIRPQLVTANSSSLSINIASGQYVILTLSTSVTSLTITGWATGIFEKCILEIRNQGAFGISGWGAKWPGGVPPTITSGAGKIDRVALSSGDNGVTVLGDVIAQNYS